MEKAIDPAELILGIDEYRGSGMIDDDVEQNLRALVETDPRAAKTQLDAIGLRLYGSASAVDIGSDPTPTPYPWG